MNKINLKQSHSRTTIDVPFTFFCSNNNEIPVLLKMFCSFRSRPVAGKCPMVFKVVQRSPKNSTSKVIPSYPRNVPYTWTKSETFPDFLTLWGRCRLSLPRPWHTEAIQNKLRMFRTRFVVVMNHLRPSENNCGLITQCRYQRSNIKFRGQFHHIWVIPRCFEHLLRMLRLS